MSVVRPALRRRRDHRAAVVIARTARALVSRLDAVAGGRLLLISTGAIVVVATPLLGANAADSYTVLAVSTVMGALVVVSTLVDWVRLGRQATLLFPLAVFAALASLGVAAPHLAAALTGLLTGACVYTGLTQRPGVSGLVVPLGSATFVLMNGGPTHAVVVRMLVAAMVWTMIVEILALFTRQHESLTRALERAALCDPLTGLPNRRDLETRLATARLGDVVVLCDLDHFKTLNDTHGHRAGDNVLADFATLLRLELRDGDYSARYGGEEFLLHLPNTSPAGAEVVLDRLHATWQTMRPLTTFSAGIAACRPGRTISATVAAADEALYAAKAAGRNTDCVEPIGVAA